MKKNVVLEFDENVPGLSPRSCASNSESRFHMKKYYHLTKTKMFDFLIKLSSFVGFGPSGSPKEPCNDYFASYK